MQNRNTILHISEQKEFFFFEFQKDIPNRINALSCTDNSPCQKLATKIKAFQSAFKVKNLEIRDLKKSLSTTPALASASPFMLMFSKSSYFLNHLMILVHIWYTDGYRSKVSISNILPWPIGHKRSKTRSQGQCLEKPWVHF